MNIQQMTYEHIEAVQQIAQLSWHKTYEQLIPETIRNEFLSFAYSDEMLQHRLAHSPFYVATINHKMLGFANFSPINDQQEIELSAIYVHPDFELQGIGSRLLKHAEHHLSPKSIFVNVEAANTIGHNFYRAKGFKKIAQFEEDFQGHRLHTIRLKKEVTNQLTIKTVTDSEQIIAVIHAAFKRYESDAMPSSALSETSQTIERDLKNGIVIFGAYVNEVLVGVVKVTSSKEQLYFSRLAVNPTEQGKGMASALVAHIENYAANHKIFCITCKVRKSESDNIRLYTKLGYNITKEEITSSPFGYVMSVVTMEKTIAANLFE